MVVSFSWDGYVSDDIGARICCTYVKTSVDEARKVADFLADVVVRFMDTESIGTVWVDMREELLEQIVAL